MGVKGQDVLDAANARRSAEVARKVRNQNEKQEAEADKALVVLHESGLDPEALQKFMDPRSGYQQPRTLGALEGIVEKRAEEGAAKWREAANALSVIKAFKLWKQHLDDEGKPKFKNFVEYAEERFGFKKTYAYDLVKAAERKPEALTEGEAREEMKQERGVSPLNLTKGLQMLTKHWERFEDRFGDVRDRIALSETNDEFVEALDTMMRGVGDTIREFLAEWEPIEGNVVDPEAATQKPLRADAQDDDDEAPESDADEIEPDSFDESELDRLSAEELGLTEEQQQEIDRLDART